VDLPQESEFVERARSGDRVAFSALVDRYWSPLRSWLHGLSRDTHRAEDVTQETFLRAWVKLPGLRDPKVFRVWLFRIARNLLLVEQRRPAARSSEFVEELPDGGGGPDSQAMANEGKQALNAAIDRLGEPYKAAFLLWSQAGFPFAEIARILDISEENARWRVCQSRQMLVRALQSFLKMPT